MKPKRLVWQIFPSSLLIVFCAIGAVSWYVFSVFENFYFDEATKNITARVALIKPQVSHLLTDHDITGLRDFVVRAGRESKTRITVVDKAGLVLADSNENPERMDNHGHRPEIMEAYAGKIGVSKRHSDTLNENLFYVAVPLLQEGQVLEDVRGVANTQIVVRMSVALQSIQDTMAKLRRKIVYSALLVILLAGAITYLVSRNVSKPLELMTVNAKKFAQGDFSSRTGGTKNLAESLEVATLGTAMDRMADLLDEKIRAIETHRNQLETVFSSMVEAVIAIDRNEQIISMNNSAARLLGVRRENPRARCCRR